MARKQRKKLTGAEVGSAFDQAALEMPGPFDLSGRGHEARCTFDRSL